MSDDDNLPVPRDEERIERLRETAEALDNGEERLALVPFEAYDIGDVDERANPRACDLGYIEGGDASVASNLGGTDHIMYDEMNGDARIECDDSTFIEDVSQHN
jgi:hypothetical protein